MSSVQTTITITHGKESIGTVQNKVLKPSSKAHEEAVALQGFFNALNGGDRSGKLLVQVNSGDAVAASGTITLASFVATNTLTVGSETFTCEASGATGNNQFNVGGTDTLTAAAAVVVINAHPNLSQTVTASSSGAVITITSKVPGKIGNYIPLAISAHGSVSASTLASGTDATTYSTQNTYRLGV